MIFYVGQNSKVDLGTKKLGVGLKQAKLKWTVEINQDFHNFLGSFSSSSDGMANLNIIKKSLNWSESNYPAVYWAYSYGLSMGGVAEGWYLPATRELCALYLVRQIVNDSLNKIENNVDLLVNGYVADPWYYSSSWSHLSDLLFSDIADFSDSEWYAAPGPAEPARAVRAIRVFN